MIRHLFLLLTLAPASLAAQGNANYDPDFDGNGCYQMADVLALLQLFGACNDSILSFTCGDLVQFDDYSYATVLIGEQCWFAENLRSNHYRNGDEIPGELSDAEWSSTSEGAQAIYDNASVNLADYGRLYNWFAVDDSRGLCPIGWHVPSDDEFKSLEIELGMTEAEASSEQWRGSDQGTQLKSAPSDTPAWNGTNTSGFSAIPGGFRYYNSGTYSNIGVRNYLWTATSANVPSAYLRRLDSGQNNVYRVGDRKLYGWSVRCIQDTE